MKIKKKLVIKALTDPKFRKLLEENPENALSPEELTEIKGGVDEILNTADYINAISQLGGQMIFCVPVKDPAGPWYA